MSIRKPFSTSILLILTVFISIFWSCAKDSSPINCTISEFEEFPENRDLFFSDLAEYKEGIAANILVHDSLLIIHNRDKSGKYFFHNYSLTQNKFSKGYLKRGKGPGEALGVFTSGITEGFLWAHDITRGSVFQLKLSELTGDAIVQPYSVKDLKDFYFHLAMVDSNSYYAIGHELSESKISFGTLNNSGKRAEFGDFCMIDEDVPIEVFKDAYASIIVTKPGGEKVVVAYRYTDVIEIFDIKDQTFKTISGPEKFNVEYAVGQSEYHNYMAKTRKTRKAFIVGASTEEHIYLLFSGFHNNHRNWSYAKKLYIYTWDGIPVKSYTLDRRINTIGVNQDGSTIYSFDENNGYLISAQLGEE